jgi:hypothetical protein
MPQRTQGLFFSETPSGHPTVSCHLSPSTCTPNLAQLRTVIAARSSKLVLAKREADAK